MRVARHTARQDRLKTGLADLATELFGPAAAQGLHRQMRTGVATNDRFVKALEKARRKSLSG